MTAIFDFIEKMWGALLSFNFPSDFLDIILVTLLIFEAIKLLRGSRSFQVIKGIAFLIILFLLVKLFKMEASEYLLSMLFENALLILVVLFSPEIRNMLEKFGRRSFRNISFLNFKNDEEFEKVVTTTVNDFCKSAADMSETKTGALVVFEREAPLQEIINSGTVLDACSSVELLNGLFFKNSALHDGAVVVRDGRVYAAGCILPLTQNISISSELGTRHRAAIGMSEGSDAVVVVVSEETGDISVAQNGVLTRGIQTGKLREILLSSLIKTKDEPDNKNKKLKNTKKSSKNKKSDDSAKDGGENNGEV